MHVCVDDYSRLTNAGVLPYERTAAIGFRERAVSFYRVRGIRVERLLTHNRLGLCLGPTRTRLRRLRIRHSRTRA